MATTMVNLVFEPEVQAFAGAAANPSYEFDLGPIEGRKDLDQTESGALHTPEVAIEDTTVPGAPNAEVSVRIMRPTAAIGLLPTIVYIRGVGWVFGNALTHDRLIQEVTFGAGRSRS